MAAVGTLPIYEMTIEWQRGANLWNNVLYWEATVDPGGTVGSGRLNDAFIADVASNWLLAISNAVTLVSLDTRRLNNLIDFEFDAVGTSGGRAGDRAPDYMAVRCKKIRTDKSTRSGWFMVSGMLEADIAGNDWTASALALIDTFLADIDANIASGGTTFTPVIVGGKEPSGVPAAEADWIVNLISEHVSVAQSTTQRTRITGAGQ